MHSGMHRIYVAIVHAKLAFTTRNVVVVHANLACTTALWMLCMPNVRHVIKTIKVRNQPETFLHEILGVEIIGGNHETNENSW
jgi:hypothetical protein